MTSPDPSNGTKIYIRATECNRIALADEKAIGSFLEDVTELIGMNAMEPPFTYRIGDGEPYHSKTDMGITGHTAWKESGAMLHTWPELGLLHFDCESCKEFDVGKLADFTRAVFRALNIRVYDLSYVMRGGESAEGYKRLRETALAAYKALQRLSPGCDEALRLGAELFL